MASANEHDRAHESVSSRLSRDASSGSLGNAFPDHLLLDTNVLLDYYIGSRPSHNATMGLLRKACANDVGLYYPVHCSKDLFFLIHSGFKQDARSRNGGALSEGAAAAANEMAWACIEHLSQIATAVGCDSSDVWVATKQKPLHADYEDDLVIAAAIRSRALLVTNDEGLAAHSPIAAMSVEDALAYLNSLTA